MPRRLALLALNRWEKGRHHSDDVATAVLAEADPAPAPADRRLFTELFFGVIRRRATLDAVFDAYSTVRRARAERSLLAALRVALYQLIFLDRVPPAAAVNECVRLLARGKEGRGAARARFAPGLLRAVARDIRRDVAPGGGEAAPAARDRLAVGDRVVAFGRPVFPDPAKDETAWLAAAWSYPAWLVARWRERMGAQAARVLLAAGNVAPPVTARVNTFRIDAPTLKKRLEAEGAGVEPAGRPDALRVVPPGDVAALRSFREGLFTVQDETPMNMVALLDVQPDDQVLDLCAAPGGKTIGICLAMGAGGRGTVTALDASPGGVARVRENLARLGLDRVETCRMDFLKASPDRRFDRVFLDAPCTNSGVIARRADLRWRLQPGDFAASAARQRALLGRAFDCLRPGGVLVYSTCSVDREENEEVARAVLAERPGARLIDTRLVMPQGGRHDGGFAALFSGSRS
ncbi:MAG: methyltransferase domain-containing protein [Planctomycetes bacterium]|nr:methyltransferase domain-containing protein [Planctomycetota bacterium]